MGTTLRFVSQLLIAIFIYFFCNFLTLSTSNLKESCPEKVGTSNAGLLESNAPNTTGCLPCSHEYLTSTYIDSQTSQLDSDFQEFLIKNIGSNYLCRWLDYNVKQIRVSNLNRHLIGEGFHRQLVSKARFSMLLDAKWLDDHICEAIIIERLTSRIFADPFELQHLVERMEFLAMHVFGDTNLELPSAISNRSIVEVHVALACNIALKSCDTVVQLPLHARYPPLNSSGYAEVTIGKPDMFLRCRPKYFQNETCSWTVVNLDSGTNNVMWRIPCGNEALAGIVSSVTFVSALFSSLLIVLSACFFQE